MRPGSAVVRTIASPAAKIDVALCEVERIQRHRFGLLVMRQISRRDTHHHLRRTIHVIAFAIALVRPTSRGWRGNKSISWGGSCGSRVGTHRHAKDVFGIRL